MRANAAGKLLRVVRLVLKQATIKRASIYLSVKTVVLVVSFIQATDPKPKSIAGEYLRCAAITRSNLW
jgi:hypothetical protein